MALKFQASADVQFDVVLCCDESVESANTQEALKALLEHGDMDNIEVPDDATVVTVRALTQRELNAVQSRAPVPQGILPVGAVRDDGDAPEKSVDERIQDYFETLSADERHEKEVVLGDWHYEHNLALCTFGVAAISDLPDAKPVRKGRLTLFPERHLLELPAAALVELALHINRLTQVGKAPSSR
jgi:hypothetical protein